MMPVEELTTDTMTSEAKSIAPPGDSTLTNSVISQKEAEITTNIPRALRRGATLPAKRENVPSKSS